MLIPIGIISALTILWTQTYSIHEFVVEKYEQNKQPRLEIHKPEHPEKRPIRQYLSDYGSHLSSDDYIDDLIDVTTAHAVDPKLVVAILILESGGGRDCRMGFNCYGYGGGLTRFDSHREALEAVSTTLEKYRARGIVEVRDIASVWRTGGRNDTSDYPDKVVWIMQQIERKIEHLVVG